MSGDWGCYEGKRHQSDLVGHSLYINEMEQGRGRRFCEIQASSGSRGRCILPALCKNLGRDPHLNCRNHVTPLAQIKYPKPQTWPPLESVRQSASTVGNVRIWPIPTLREMKKVSFSFSCASLSCALFWDNKTLRILDSKDSPKLQWAARTTNKTWEEIPFPIVTKYLNWLRFNHCNLVILWM